MGVPKFYKWISERYPCLSEDVNEFQIPEFDNLYLDINGIIHDCSRPEYDNPHFQITEEKIFSDTMYYIDFLFRMIKPKKVFFMAVDGVAPRAKMNQQRARRFRSARKAQTLEQRAQANGEVLHRETRFDRNSITSGTPFMVRLQKQLQSFVVNKTSTDPLWQGVRVYLSGHETPGEGEHKIMDFIRAERAKVDYHPNTRHCLFPIHADLVMLGLAAHEPRFSLLKADIRFGNKRLHTPEETTFHLLHLSLLREYLDIEFSALKDNLHSFKYDLENIIDDWVLMGFLVGNDFIPHLPNLLVNHDALPLLWQTYIDVLPSCGGKSLLLVALLGLVIFYIYALILFAFYRNWMWSSVDGHHCTTVYECFVSILHHGLVESPYTSFYANLGPSFPVAIGITFYDVSFFIIITTIGLNIIFGIIVDTFSELRDSKWEIDKDMRDTCFICSKESYDFERQVGGFNRHVREEHNTWAYLFFFIHLDETRPNDYSALELYVYKLLMENNFDFFPLNRALSLENEEDTKEQRLEHLQEQIDFLVSKIKEQEAELQREKEKARQLEWEKTHVVKSKESKKQPPPTQ